MPFFLKKEITGFINLVKTLGAVVNPKGKQLNSKSVSSNSNLKNFRSVFSTEIR